jgi:hypothetical protein
LRRRGIRSLLSRIERLSYVVNRYSGASTHYQVEQAEVISKRLNDLIEELNFLIEKSIPELNNMLNENNISPLHPRKPVKNP